eukprot:CAMPEP_0114248552 /NCGR_PEP_ID=MMETSP0058-20121206/13635_1 /TAXON_ID=36894 /ORGANISM="Pyramimonas parkeae, CCMP726" /LENGTH=240 /DNA_ID=CAMNT_0001361969 /DNA_START=194 /DNA_END=916 /DNA_ORIENTATION=-
MIGGVGVQSGVDRQWEDLRKQARKLESEIDQKLSAFSKLGNGQESETAELLGSRQDTVSTYAAAIEHMLERLSHLNEAMEGVLSGPTGGGVARMHTLARHKDILSEFSNEFRRTRSSITHGLQHSELTGLCTSSTGSTAFLPQESGSNSANLLKERNMIDSSVVNIDNVIGQAQASLSTLTGQGEMFQGMGQKLNTLGSKYPMINSLMTSIRRKRSQETIILSAVIACCTLFMFLYWLSK